MQEAQDFWRQALEAVERPIARKLASQLDLTNPLGLPPAVAARRRGTRRQKAPLYPFHLQVKNKHPTKIVLVRVRVAALLWYWVPWHASIKLLMVCLALVPQQFEFAMQRT